MTTSEPLFAAAREGPSLLGAGLRVALAVALLVAAAWAWMYWQRRVKGPNRPIEVLDRVMLARGAGVTLLRVGDRRLLLGVSSEGVRMLGELDADLPGHRASPAFGEALDAAVRGREVTP